MKRRHKSFYGFIITVINIITMKNMERFCMLLFIIIILIILSTKKPFIVKQKDTLVKLQYKLLLEKQKNIKCEILL